MNEQAISLFQEVVWNYYHDHGRSLPWRNPEPDGSFNAYKILVSEIMLQQTQASRVIPKYQEFLNRFPTLSELGTVELADVLVLWNGLGYNRRAKFLWQIGQATNGQLPSTLDELIRLPGIGHNTAAAIMAYAYNQPVVFIETNIRTVFIHHFFNDQIGISDKELMPYIESALDHEHPREWYWALMDYGVYIKSTIGNASRNSSHYAKQSKFEGSKRQIRGQIIRALANHACTAKELEQLVTDPRLSDVLQDLVNEQLVKKTGTNYSL